MEAIIKKNGKVFTQDASVSTKRSASKSTKCWRERRNQKRNSDIAKYDRANTIGTTQPNTIPTTYDSSNVSESLGSRPKTNKAIITNLDKYNTSTNRASGESSTPVLSSPTSEQKTKRKLRIYRKSTTQGETNPSIKSPSTSQNNSRGSLLRHTTNPTSYFSEHSTEVPSFYSHTWSWYLQFAGARGVWCSQYRGGQDNFVPTTQEEEKNGNQYRSELSTGMSDNWETDSWDENWTQRHVLNAESVLW